MGAVGPVGDAIVTFNYDRVVETARDAAKGGCIVEALPHADTSGDVPLFKLHGSVDWQRAGGSIQSNERADFALVCSDDEMVIASPGPTKSAVATQLQDLWERALLRIRQAEAVVFIGYRFPPSDSQARRKIVAALIGNESRELWLGTVLGPDTTNKDTQRLKGILEYAMVSAGRFAYGSADSLVPRMGGPRTYRVRVHGMGAEDFLDLYENGHLSRRAI